MIFAAAWARAFALTLGVELVVAVLLLGGGGERLGRRLTAVCLAQLASHPLIWFIFPLLGLGRARYIVVAETWAILVELVLYRLVFTKLSWSRLLAVSALANGVSFAVGLLLR